MSKIIVLAVLLLAAAAAADSFRPGSREGGAVERVGAEPIGRVPPRASHGLVAAGGAMRTHVVFQRHEYLSAEELDGAFPGGYEGAPFDVAHVAKARDGTVAVAIYKFPFDGSDPSAIEVWRHGKLISAFAVPPGTFGGGLWFTAYGRRIAAMGPNGLTIVVYDRAGREVASTATTRS